MLPRDHISDAKGEGHIQRVACWTPSWERRNYRDRNRGVVVRGWETRCDEMLPILAPCVARAHGPARLQRGAGFSPHCACTHNVT